MNLAEIDKKEVGMKEMKQTGRIVVVGVFVEIVTVTLVDTLPDRDF